MTGQVKAAGIVKFAPGEAKTVLRAIFKAGGFDQFAKKSKVLLIRQENGKRKRITVDVELIMEKGEMDKDVTIKHGDMIIVDEKWINF